MKERKLICKMCGNEYTTTGNYSKYCPNCYSAAQKYRQMKFLEKHPTYNRDYKREKRKGEKDDMVRKRICNVCGKEYIVRANNQKYCPECVKTAQKTYDIKSYRKKVKRQEGERVLADFQRDLLEFAANNWLPFHVHMLKGAIECVSKGEKTYPIGGEQDGSSKKDGKESVYCLHG